MAARYQPIAVFFVPLVQWLGLIVVGLVRLGNWLLRRS
jgi:hypothetical protein